MKHTITFIFFCCIIAQNLLAQDANVISGELIVRLYPQSDIKQLLADFSRFEGKTTQLRIKRSLIKSLNTYQLLFDAQHINPKSLLAAVRGNKKVLLAQFNHTIELRNTPNDPLFGDQWQYENNGINGLVADADIDATAAWDITTGGNTVYGDTIVVAVLDDGCNAFHPDWGNNIWVNRYEIPFNGIDDDENGYIDDYRGYNTYTDDDDIGGGSLGGDHGTPVAGIIGAKGNNGIGVSGVNWNVKVMIVVASGDEADAIAGYGYVLANREQYNSTNGQKGAFVVATNASWGVNFGQPADAPIWCSLYDDLGNVGILSAGATANANTNVDTQGDLPTACPSDYLISVTNMLSNNTKYSNAGYGANSIDLGAYGQNAITINVSGSYGIFTGTSSATPHVAGAIGLLYSVGCPQFIEVAKTNPAQAALLAKQFIMQGSVPNPTLAGITVSGGVLNLQGMLQQALAYGCSVPGCDAPFGLFANQLNATDATFTCYADPADGQSFVVSYATGFPDPPYTTLISTSNSITLSDLLPCTLYELHIATICGTDTSEYTNLLFNTKGCCLPPENITPTNMLYNLERLSWDPVFAAFGYNVQFKPSGGSNWTNISTSDTTLVLSNLLGCTTYDYRISTNCSTGVQSEFSDTLQFTTYGCGACIDFTYCSAKGQDSGSEWVAGVQIGNWQNQSGNDDGYKDYSNVSLQLDRGVSYPISLTPGYIGGTFAEYFKVWIDFDQNGSYQNDINELVYDSGFPQPNMVSGNFAVPGNAIPGQTRMRVVMKYVEPNSSEPYPCGTFTFGEVEDYCINISNNPVGINNVYSSNFELKAHINQQNMAVFVVSPINQTATLLLSDVTGRVIMRTNTVLDKGNNKLNLNAATLASGVYILTLQTPNGNNTSIKVVKVN
jgi:serine protease